MGGKQPLPWISRGGHSREVWVELCRRGLQTPTLFQKKLAHFDPPLGFNHSQVSSLSENWKKVNNDPVCFGARSDSYGAFNIIDSINLHI